MSQKVLPVQQKAAANTQSVNMNRPQRAAAGTHEPQSPKAPAPRAASGTPHGHDLSRVPVRHSAPPAVQRKRLVGRAEDQYEQEADEVAEAVMRSHARPAPLAGRAPLTVPHPAQSANARPALAAPLKSVPPPALVPKQDDEARARRTSGSALPLAERRFFEERMGFDFGSVRIHTDALAVTASRDLQARAFTISNNISFNAGEYSTGTAEGRRLLAHELTHVVQQGAAGRARVASSDSEVGRVAGPFPRVSPMGTRGVVQRQEEKKEKKKAPPEPHPELAAAAEKLGADNKESYEKFQSGDRNWFFSPNGKLDGARRKPNGLDSFAQFEKLSKNNSSAARVITDLAGLDDTNISKADWQALKKAYGQWPSKMFAVFQAVEDRKGWTCNIFLGDSLFMAGKTKMRGGDKYYSAAEIRKYPKVFVEVPPESIQRGDIVSMHGGGHVEIVTKVIKRKTYADGFCSLGGGREGTIGEEKCDELSLFESDREIDSSDNKFFRVK
jgi:hypothetical protein